MKDELLGLADSPDSDQVFKNHGLNMDILYRTGETQQVILYLKSPAAIIILSLSLIAKVVFQIYCSSCLYIEIHLQGILTYTPRLVSVDFQGIISHVMLLGFN